MKNSRTFEGLAASYALDLVGDVISPGAFQKSLAEWRAGAYSVPLVDNHRYDSVRRVLGHMVDAEERSAGLWARFEVVESPNGDELLTQIKSGSVGSLSIGYHTIRSEPVQVDGVRVRDLKEIRLNEVSAVVFPANPKALIDRSSVKFAGARLAPTTRSAAGGWAPDDPERLQVERLLRDVEAQVEADARAVRAKRAARDTKMRELERELERRTHRAPSDPHRLRMEDQLRSLQLQSLRLSA